MGKAVILLGLFLMIFGLMSPNIMCPVSPNPLGNIFLWACQTQWAFLGGIILIGGLVVLIKGIR